MRVSDVSARAAASRPAGRILGRGNLSQSFERAGFADGARVSLPVKRRVKAADFLNETLKAFDAGATDAERKQGWSPATYGAHFVSARLKNKKAFVRFTMPAGAKFPDRFSPLEFNFAVADTVLQFWNEIDEIEVCLDGIIDFYAEYPERIPCEQEQNENE